MCAELYLTWSTTSENVQKSDKFYIRYIVIILFVGLPYYYKNNHYYYRRMYFNCKRLHFIIIYFVLFLSIAYVYG